MIISYPGLISNRNQQDERLSGSGQIIDKTGITIRERFLVPDGYRRTWVDSNSFAFYLRNLKLKTFDARVTYYDGTPKANEDIYISVVDMEIGNRDLQQCADAVMRLRAEYLYSCVKYDDIHFNFISDGKPRYYMDYAAGDYSYLKFRKYLDYVFSYANTRSLNRELLSRDGIDDMQIGDVLIQTGNPYGHAVIVVDMAENTNGEKLFILAQSYMPAQDIQILVNRNDPQISPWYRLREGEISTPEWTFRSSDLKQFPE